MQGAALLFWPTRKSVLESKGIQHKERQDLDSTRTAKASAYNAVARQFNPLTPRRTQVSPFSEISILF